MKEEISLQDVLSMGGDSHDFNLLNSNSKHFGKKNELKKSEFQKFYKDLGFSKFKDSNVTPIHNKTEEDCKDAKEAKNTIQQNIETSVKIQNKKASKKSSKKRKKEENCRTGLHIILDKKESDDFVKKTTSMNSEKINLEEYKKIINVARNHPNRVIVEKKSNFWYEYEISKSESTTLQFNSQDEFVKKLKKFASDLFESEIASYKKDMNDPDSNTEWINTVISSGTISDKIAAYTLLINKSPLHNISYLSALLSLVNKKGAREVLLGMEKFSDVVIETILPESRKLKYFHQHPLNLLLQLADSKNKNKIQLMLIYWIFEDKLKSLVVQFVSRLAELLQDKLDPIKVKGMRTVLTMLLSRPEQEHILLKMLVNKFGDPKYKIASKALHMLHSLINTHPAMQQVIVKEVRDLLLRPNVNEKCQYYCICFLSSMMLSQDQNAVAEFLIEIYLAFYKAASTRKKINDKLLSALLTGVNRAYPFTTSSNEKIANEMNTLYKTVHSSSVSSAVQSLMLLFQILSSKKMLDDRYYNALYGLLLHQHLPTTNIRHPMFLNLLYRSLKNDDLDIRIQAFVKRLLQSCTVNAVPYSSACLVLLIELFSCRPSLKNSLTTSKEAQEALSDDEEERFVDVDKTDLVSIADKDKITESWTHLEKHEKNTKISKYDPFSRAPLYNNANATTLWELNTMYRHFHPTVVLYTKNLAKLSKNEDIEKLQSDPLQDFTLMRFLDKFVYRNPKANPKSVPSINTTFSRRHRMQAGTNDVAANTIQFLNKKDIRPEEMFLQKYFQSQMHGNDIQHEDATVDSDAESDLDEEFETYLATKEGKINLYEGLVMEPNTEEQKLYKGSESEDEMSDLDNEEVDFVMSEDEDPFDECGGTFATDDLSKDFAKGVNKDYSKPKGNKRVKASGKKKKTELEADAFGSMLEENAHNRFNSTGSGAVLNANKIGAKQIKWERKREEKEIISRKRAFKRKTKTNSTKKFKKYK